MEVRAPQNEKEWLEYYSLRYRLLRESLGQELGSEKNEGDQNAIHFALFDNQQIMAIGRLDERDDKSMQARFVAVEKNNQGKGYGLKLMQAMEKKCIELNKPCMFLQARENAVEFYKKQGYTLIEKTHLLLGQVQHYSMEKVLD
jgi:predicted GNAT family N-acyltransferase